LNIRVVILIIKFNPDGKNVLVAGGATEQMGMNQVEILNLDASGKLILWALAFNCVSYLIITNRYVLF
jgi:hypothetical protein